MTTMTRFRLSAVQAEFLTFCDVDYDQPVNPVSFLQKLHNNAEGFKDSKPTSNLKASAAFTAANLITRLSDIGDQTIEFYLKGQGGKKRQLRKPRPAPTGVTTPIDAANMTVDQIMAGCDPVPDFVPPPDGGYTLWKGDKKRRTCKTCGFPHGPMKELFSVARWKPVHLTVRGSEWKRLAAIMEFGERNRQNLRPGVAVVLIEGIVDNEIQFSVVAAGLAGEGPAMEVLRKISQR